MSKMTTNIQHERATRLLMGKTVSLVTKVDADEGLTIHFSDGTRLEFVYNGCEGNTTINDEELS